ncbi:hypothetical protein BaRGS_00002447, partial [Batillaria attramentaria]
MGGSRLKPCPYTHTATTASHEYSQASSPLGRDRKTLGLSPAPRQAIRGQPRPAVRCLSTITY